MPEWSNGPHSKCGVRATVPGVRIPLCPLRAVEILLFLFLLIRPANFAGCFVFDDHSCKLIYKGVPSNTSNTACCRINKKQKRGLRTLCRGLPPRLITSRYSDYVASSVTATPFESLYCSVQGALRRAKGKTSSASRYEVNPSTALCKEPRGERRERRAAEQTLVCIVANPSLSAEKKPTRN